MTTMLHPLDTCQSQYCTADAVPSYYATMPNATPPFYALCLMQPFTYTVNPLPSFPFIYITYILSPDLHSHSCAMKVPYFLTFCFVVAYILTLVQ